jgi:acetyl esterase/lipase
MIKAKHIQQYRIGIATVGVLIAAIAAIAYMMNGSFKEEVDEVYYSVFSKLLVEPQMRVVADKKQNIQYCNTSSRLQRLDVYTPKNVEQTIPVVVYIHGGGWGGGDKINDIVTDYGAEIVKNNMALVSVNYRFAPASTYPAQSNDIECAITYLKAHASELHIDMTRIGLFGDSAGGQLAAMAAFNSPNKQLVKAVVEFYGTSDMWAQITRKPRPDKEAIHYVGSATNETLAKAASPLYANHAGAPPFLLFHGLNDKTIHYDTAVKYAEKLKQDGVDATLVGVQSANHHFSSKSSPNQNAIEDQVVVFLKKHLLSQ